VKLHFLFFFSFFSPFFGFLECFYCVVVGGESGTMADSLFISQEIGFANFQKKKLFLFFCQ
jgi:hypothetical protein